MTDDITPRKLYDQVADRVRQEIADERWPPGEVLPSEAQLCQDLGVSRNTVRQALAVLRAEGHLEVIQGKGTFVRRAPLHLALRRYQRGARRPGIGPFETAARDAGIAGRGELVLVEERKADDLMAARLGIEPGDGYIVRRRLMHGEDDKIIQVQEGHLPLDLVTGTPLAGAEKIVDGTYVALDAIGHGPASITETVSARALTSGEATVFSRPAGTPVICVERTTRDEGGLAVEWLTMVALAESTVLVYEDLPVD